MPHKSTHIPHRTVIALLSATACLTLLAPATRAGRHCLPHDFPLHPITYGGAGGGSNRAERAAVKHLPVIMIAAAGRTHHDWTGRHPGNAPADSGVSVYDRLRGAGFQPIELWMIDFARPGEQMSSLEEATDDLKFFITAVMRYTGTPRVQLLAHGSGCLLARLTLIKYHIAHWVDREVYIAGPFQGISPPAPPEKALHGFPNAWCTTPGSPLLHEIAMHGQTLVAALPGTDRRYRVATMTLRNGSPGGDACFTWNPDSPALRSAVNLTFPSLDHDGLRCAAATAAAYIPFLQQPVAPFKPEQDRDRDGFISADFGGPDLADDNPAIYPGAPEVPGDGIDQDCNGHDLSPRFGRDGEVPLSAGMRNAECRARNGKAGQR